VFKERSPKVVPIKLSHRNARLCGVCEIRLSTISLLRCGNKKGIAIPYFRAHSNFTAIKKTCEFLVSVLTQQSGQDF
jgi:hypothetical protein